LARVELGAGVAARFVLDQRVGGPWPVAAPAGVFGPQGVPLALGRVGEGGRLSPQRLFRPPGSGQPG